jgi:hypothetical protein
MKRLFVPTTVALFVTVLLTGCLALQVGGGDKKELQTATVGQQLVDLQKAKDAGAISDSEYQAQKAKLLGSK